MGRFVYLCRRDCDRTFGMSRGFVVPLVLGPYGLADATVVSSMRDDEAGRKSGKEMEKVSSI